MATLNFRRAVAGAYLSAPDYNFNFDQIEPYMDEVTETILDEVDEKVSTATIATGTIIWFAKNNVPTGYLVCDGSAVKRTGDDGYNNLFLVIGTAFGSGDGSTTFNLPNLMGYSPKGSNTVGTYSDATSTDGTVSSVGNHQHAYDWWGRQLGSVTGGAGSHSHTYSYRTDVARLTLLPCIKY